VAWSKQATCNMQGGNTPSSKTRMHLGIHIYTSNQQQAIQEHQKTLLLIRCLSNLPAPSPLSSQPRLLALKTHSPDPTPLKERRGDNHGIHPVHSTQTQTTRPPPRNSQPNIKSERKRKERKELAVQKKRIVKKG
jgi:hypothetical protein